MLIIAQLAGVQCKSCQGNETRNLLIFCWLQRKNGWRRAILYSGCDVSRTSQFAGTWFSTTIWGGRPTAHFRTSPENISSIAPRCLKQGITNNDAFSYFMSWSRGELSRPQRPFSYVHLHNRCASLSSPNLKHQVGPHQLELNMLICLLVGMMRILMMMLNM